MNDMLSLDQAHAAARHARDIIADCKDVDDLDEASSVKTIACPSDFSENQRALVQLIVLDAYLAAIGRA